MKDKLISIIVPVYNAENYIDRCLNSIIQQSYSNIEIIVVNDGSNDNSLNKIQTIKNESNTKIIVIDQENKGEGLARNEGIKHISGEYFTFVDADDEIKKDAVKDFVNVLDANTDIVICGFETIYNDKSKIDYHIPNNKSLWTELRFPCTAFKLYRTEYILNNNFVFTNHNISCDVVFNVVAFSYTSNIKFINKSNYLNHINETSATATINKKKITNILDVLITIEDKINKSKYNNQLIKFFYLKTITHNIIMQLSGFKTDTLKKMYYENYEWINNINKVHLLIQKNESWKINFIINMFILSKKTNTTYILINILKKLGV